MTPFKGTAEYWHIVKDDADLLEHAADRLTLYQANAPWLTRKLTAFVIGFLRGRAHAMRANAELGSR